MSADRHRGAVSVTVLAGVTLLQAAMPAAAQQQQAGVTAAVRGTVELAERPGAVGRLVKSGEPVFLGNAIKSAVDSGLQLMLLDETTFTIGPNSEITIDEFVYDPRTSAGKVTASVAKGVFRFVTGKVSQQDPSSMQVRLPTGNIGIRGTIAMGRVDTIEQNGQTVPRQQVILVGPGGSTEANRRGGLMLTLPNQVGQGTEIWRAGFGSESIGGNPWSPPVFMGDLLAALLQSMRPPSQPGGNGLPPPNPDAAAQDARFQQVRAQGQLLNNQQVLDETLQFANTIQSVGSQSGIRDMRGVVDGFSTYEQLRTINSGQFFWSQNNVAFDGFSASYNLSLNVNFANRTVGGGTSRVDINSSMPGSVGLPSQSYSSFSGAAAFNFNNLTGFFDPSICEVSCTINVQAKPMNSGGVVAQGLQHTVKIVEDGNTITSGSGTTGPRRAGSAP
jgi:FecR protein